MVEKGFVTEQDFREFTFTNAARLHTRNNPDFFKGTFRNALPPSLLTIHHSRFPSTPPVQTQTPLDKALPPSAFLVAVE